MCDFMYICVKHAPCIGVCTCLLWSLCLWSYLYTCVWLCLCVGGFLACNFVRLMCLGMHMCVCAYINAAHEETCTNVCTYACTYICSLERSHTWLTLLPNHPRWQLARIHMNTFIHVFTCTHSCTCSHTCTRSNMCTQAWLHRCVNIYACSCVYVYTCMHMCASMHMSVYRPQSKSMHIVYAYLCTCRVCMRVCVYGLGFVC
jgi:hypothetical protein